MEKEPCLTSLFSTSMYKLHCGVCVTIYAETKVHLITEQQHLDVLPASLSKKNL